MRRDFEEIFVAELVSITFGLFAGFLLSHVAGDFSLIPGLIILLPGFLGMRGNISGSLSARLGSALHLGSIKPSFRGNSFLWQNVAASFLLAVVMSVFLGFVACFASLVFGLSPSLKLVYISLVAAVISNGVQIPVTVVMLFWLFSHNYDPDNIMGPYVTSTGDIISVVSLLVAVMLV